jgi:hypothetical protein
MVAKIDEGEGSKCGSMERIYFLDSGASIVSKNFEGVELQG